MIIPFHAIFLFLYPLKMFSEVFRGYGNETVWDKLISWICTTCTDKTPSSSPACSVLVLFAITGWRRFIKPLTTRLIKTWDYGNLKMKLTLIAAEPFSPSYIQKKLYWKILQNSQENICGGVLCWRKVHTADSKEQLFCRSLVTSYALSLILCCYLLVLSTISKCST